MYEVRDQFNLSNKCHVKVPVLSKKPIDAGGLGRRFPPSRLYIADSYTKKWLLARSHQLLDGFFWDIFVYKMIDFLFKTMK